MGRIADLYREVIMELEGGFREGTQETPDRVERAWKEILDGYTVDIKSLFKTFSGEEFKDAGQDQILVVRNIDTWSVCEHHLLPFNCRINIAYLPINKVIGLSKIERLAHAYAHRLQLQERIACQIGNTIMEELQPQGVGVIIEGTHLCMKCRGVKSSTTKVINSVMLGQFRIERTLRLEVLSLLGGNHD